MATLTNTRLEETPTGTTNVSGIINANTQQVEKILNPANGVHDYDGTTGDVGNLVRDCLLRDGVVTHTDDGAVAVDFEAMPNQRLSLTQDTTFTFNDIGVGKLVVLTLVNDGTAHTLTWPAAAKFSGASGASMAPNEEATIILVPVAAGEVRAIWARNPDAPSSETEYGSVTVEGNPTATTISASSTDWSNAVQVAGFDTDGASSANVTPDHTNDHVTVGIAGVYRVSAQASVSGAASATLSFAVFKNNKAAQVGTRATVSMASGTLAQLTITATVALAASDTIELWIQNETGTDNPTVEDARIDVAAA